MIHEQKIRHGLQKQRRVVKREFEKKARQRCEAYYQQIAAIEESIEEIKAEEDERFLQHWARVEARILAKLEKEFQDWDAPEQEFTQRRCIWSRLSSS